MAEVWSKSSSGSETDFTTGVPDTGVALTRVVGADDAGARQPACIRAQMSGGGEGTLTRPKNDHERWPQFSP